MYVMELENDTSIDGDSRTAHEYFGLFTARRGLCFQRLTGVKWVKKIQHSRYDRLLRRVRSGQVSVLYLSNNNNLPFHRWRIRDGSRGEKTL